jgi:hypothetical protein
MQRWEYLEVITANDNRILFIDGKETKWTSRPTLTLYLDELGEEGWELVGIMEKERTFYFKRPLQEETSSKRA